MKGLAGSRFTTGVPFLAEVRITGDEGIPSWTAGGLVRVESSGELDLVPADANLKALRERGVLGLPVHGGASAAFFILATAPGIHDLGVSWGSLTSGLSLRVEGFSGNLAGKLFVNEVFYKADKAGQWVELSARETVSIPSLRVDLWNADLTSSRRVVFKNITIRTGEFLCLVNHTDTFSRSHGPAKAPHRVNPALELYTEGLVVLTEETPWGEGVFDSVLYKNLPETPSTGQSLERQSLGWPALTAVQWKPSSDEALSTPGRANSQARVGGFEIEIVNRFLTREMTAGSEPGRKDILKVKSDRDGELTFQLLRHDGRRAADRTAPVDLRRKELFVLSRNFFPEFAFSGVDRSLILVLTFQPAQGASESKKIILETLN